MQKRTLVRMRGTVTWARFRMAEKSKGESKDVEMVAEGEEKEETKEGGGEESKTKQQTQKDKDLLTFEGISYETSTRVKYILFCFQIFVSR